MAGPVREQSDQYSARPAPIRRSACAEPEREPAGKGGRGRTRPSPAAGLCSYISLTSFVVSASFNNLIHCTYTKILL